MTLLALLAPLAAAIEVVWIEGESEVIDSSFNQHSWYSDVDETLLSPGSPGTLAGSWRAHYANNSTPVQATWAFTVTEGGAYTLWARVGSYRTEAWVGLDGAAPIDLQVDEQARETVNLVDPTLDIRFLSWVKVGVVDLDPGPHTLTVGLEPHTDWGGSQLYGGVDALVVTNLPRWAPTGALQPELEEAEGTVDGWFPFLPKEEDPSAVGSPLDRGELLDAPAGARGLVGRDGAALAFADGTPARFWGVDVGELPGTVELRERQARFFARHGINAVRLHSVQAWLGTAREASGEPAFDPARLDALDHWTAALAEQGIYSCWSVFYPFVLADSDAYPAELRAELPAATGGRSTSGLVTIRPELQDAESAWLRALLAHENPYTGRTYAEEAALAFIELRNEDSIFWHSPLNDLAAGSYPAHTSELQAAWATWLAGRYLDDVALLAAWGPEWGGSRPGDSLSNPAMAIYGAWEMGADGPATNPAEARRMGDFIRFLAETQREGYERRAAAIRDTGYAGVVVSTAWQAGGEAAHLANVWTDQALDAVDRHVYAGGGAGDWRITAGSVSTWSHFDEPGGGILALVASQVEDQPFLVTEWNLNPPDPWRAEAAPIMAFYGLGLQGWDASFHFSASTFTWEGGWPGHSSYVTETPVYLGQFPALATAVHRGHLAEGPLAAAQRVTLEQATSGVDPRAYPGGGQGFDGSDSLEVPAAVALLGRVSARVDGEGAPEAVDWGDLTGVIDSLGGELRWDVPGRYAQVRSPYTQGVIGFGGGLTHTLPDATLALRTDYATVLLTPLDDEPLARSARVLVTATARDLETGAVYSADGSTLERTGGPPLLLEPVQADLTLPGSPITRVTALDVDGVARAEVPVAGDTFTIDGRWRTLWYLVERTVPEDSGTPPPGDSEPPPGDSGPTGDPGGGGSGTCGCATTRPAAPWLLGLLVGVVVRRRRPG